MSRFGLTRYDVKELINNKLKEQPDLFYYIDNSYVELLTQMLIDAVAEVIVENNERLQEDINNYIQNNNR